MGVGSRIQERRRELDMSRSELANQVGITPSAIANYENSVSYPKKEILIALMATLQVDANYLYRDYLSDQMVRTMCDGMVQEREQESIDKYRKLSDAGKEVVNMVIDEEYQRLERHGWDYYPCWKPGERLKNTGFILQEHRHVLYVPEGSIPKEADFCFQIQIDRYEPVFKKYDIVALGRRPTGHNEMGVFYLNDACYIRRLYHVGGERILKALNVMDPDVRVTEEDDFRCFGTILGKVQGEYELRME